MGNKYFKRKKILPPVQFYLLKQLFPNSYGIVRNNILIWIADLTPSPMSQDYTIKLVYKYRSTPKVYVVEPSLAESKGGKLPHVYPGNRPCLFYPKDREWHANLLIADTIVPWLSEWLLHYEIWLVTGKWHGGGIHHENGKKEESY